MRTLLLLSFVTACAVQSDPPPDNDGDSRSDQTCASFSSETTCEDAGCEWSPGNVMNDRPDVCVASSAPSCESIEDGDSCELAGCEWFPGSAMAGRPAICLPSEEASCESIEDGDSCELAGCEWFPSTPDRGSLCLP